MLEPIGQYNMMKVYRQILRSFISTPAYTYRGDTGEYSRLKSMCKKSGITAVGYITKKKLIIELTIDYAKG